MSRYVFKLPDVGEGVAEAEIVAWYVKPGDQVTEDQPLVDVMTDKATVEITSPVTGQVLSIEGEPGAQAAVGSALVVLEIAEAGPAEPAAVISPPHEPEAQPSAAPPVAVAQPTAVRPLAAPAVRQQAKDAAVALGDVVGSGPEGRVTHKDINAAAARAKAPALAAFAKRDGVETVKIVGLRRRISERMAEATRRIAHFSYVDEVDVTDLERLRALLNAGHADRPRLTVLPFFARALVRALPDFPQMNALYDDEAGLVRRHAAVHLGVATQTPSGLVVPVLRHAESFDLWRTASEISRLAEAARIGRASSEELSGSTITITSLGAIGGLMTTPVINRPEVAIIGPNKISDRPVAINGAVVIRKMMNLSCSFDHRVVDGWDAATFVQRLKGFLETPALMFVEQP